MKAPAPGARRGSPQGGQDWRSSTLEASRRAASTAQPRAHHGKLRAIRSRRDETIATAVEALQAEVLRLAPSDGARLLECLILSRDSDAETEAAEYYRALRIFATRPTAWRSHPWPFVIPRGNAASVIPSSNPNCHSEPQARNLRRSQRQDPSRLLGMTEPVPARAKPTCVVAVSRACVTLISARRRTGHGGRVHRRVQTRRQPARRVPEHRLTAKSGRRGFSMSIFPYTVIHRASSDAMLVLVVKHDPRRPGYGGFRKYPPPRGFVRQCSRSGLRARATSVDSTGPVCGSGSDSGSNSRAARDRKDMSHFCMRRRRRWLGADRLPRRRAATRSRHLLGLLLVRNAACFGAPALSSIAPRAFPL